MMKKHIYLTITIVLFIVTTIMPASASLGPDEYRIVQAVQRVKQSIVNINTYSKTGTYDISGKGIGSGVILNSDGYIITNTHVIKRATNIIVTLFNGKKYKAVILKSSSEQDLSILKINPENKLPVPKFGNSDNLRLGQKVIAIGNPMHFGWTVTTGVVSALGREIKFKGIIYQNLIQTDAAINPGNSGGALINSSGEIIGINTLVYAGSSPYNPAQGLSFAIPINEVLKIAKDIIKTKTPGRLKPWIGVNVINLTPQIAERYGFKIKTGVFIRSVVAESPAALAGIQPGDILTHLNDEYFKDKDEFKKLLYKLPPHTTFKLTLWRKNKKTNVTLKAEQISQ